MTFKKKLPVITLQVKTRREWTLNVVLFNTVESGFFYKVRWQVIVLTV